MIVLEKRSNFAVKLIFQNKLLKSGTLADFSNVHVWIDSFLCLKVHFKA